MKSILKPLIIIISIIILLGLGAFAFIFTSTSPTNTPQSEPGSNPPYNFDYSWAESSPYIAHAFGGILGKTYTNSSEAFLLNYQLGHRVFEVDFYLTTDGYTVAAHDDASWRGNATIYEDAKKSPATSAEFTYANFKSSLLLDQFHPVDLNQLFQFLRQYPDVYIVTDTKFTDEANVKKQFTAFVNEAQKINPSLLNRFIIQIYHPEMLSWIMPIYPWKSVIYTLYANPNWTPENVLTFAQTSGVKFITIWSSGLTKEIANLWRPAGLTIATHTINDFNQITQLRAIGSDLFYTDFLTP